MRVLIAAVGLVGLVVVAGHAQASMELAKKARCVACHALDKKLVGPSYQDVAAKYKGHPEAASMLFDKVRNGGSGNWGQIPMTPNGPDKISDENLKAVIQWILSGAPS
jgi:cytochrome c